MDCKGVSELCIDKNRSKHKILFILPSLRGGGAERVVLNIIRGLNQDKFEIELVALDGEGEYLDLIPENIKFFNLKKKRTRYSIFRIVKVINSEKPKIILSSAGQVAILLYFARKLLRYKPIIVNRSSTFQSQVKANKVIKMLFHLAFRNSDYVIVTTEGMKNDLVENYNVRKDKIRVMYNPIDLENIESLKKGLIEDKYFSERPVILGCGRIEKEKGFSHSIKAFSTIVKRYPKAKLLILGQGSKKGELEKLAMNLGIRDKVIFLNFRKNPFKYMANADVFVLSSLREGLPNVLLEAMACGTPVVSANCKSGPSEILENDKYGILVPVADSEALANGILKLLGDHNLRMQYSKKALEKVKEFDSKKIAKVYENFFLEILD